ncbi:unnamed protein product [Diamesa tonsa]
MPGKNDPICWKEKHKNSAAYAYQGRQNYMEDRFCIFEDIGDSEISLYGVFDGHAGDFAAQYATDILMPTIRDKIIDILKYIKSKTEVKQQKAIEKTSEKVEDQKDSIEVIEEDSLQDYVTSGNTVDYNKVLTEEILAADEKLIERTSRSALFCGTTAIMVIVDQTNKVIICSNVGDSRAVMCDNKGIVIPLSKDHKPNSPIEMKRIRDNGGYISHKGCWRVEGSLATSRSLGDYPLKQKKVIIADPEIKTFKFSDHKPKFIILASDGIFDVFSSQDAVDFVSQHSKEFHYGAKSLVKKALARKSGDNLTAIVIKFIKPKPKNKDSIKSSFSYGNYDWLK